MTVFTRALSTNNYGTSKFIVDGSNPANGTHSTITAAIASAVAATGNHDIVIRPGTYTENFTLPVGINLVGHLGDSLIPQVTIVGKITMTAAGTSSISNIRLQTNGDFFLVVSGAAASVINLNNCYLNCTNNTGISMTTSSSSASISAYDCSGDLSTTGITYSVSSSPGAVTYTRCFLGNTGLSVTPITGSAGSLAFFYSIVSSPTSCTGTCLLNFYYTHVSTSAISAIPATFDSTVQPQGALFSLFHGITNTAVSIGAGSVIEFHGNNVQSTNAIAIDGSGTIFYDAIHFGSSSSNLATTLTQIVRRIGPNVETGSSQSGQTNNLRVSNTSNTANSGALLAATVGGSSAGDPFQTFTVSGSTAWSQGIDNSVTGDPWKLSASAALGTTDVMTATTAGTVNVVLGNFNVDRAASGSTTAITSNNSSNTASSNALVQSVVAGTSAGDPFMSYVVGGAQTWSLGLDNSDSDAFVLSAASSLGTNNVMRVSTAGEINYPLQPAFLASAASQTDVTGDGTAYTVTFATEIFDQGSNFASPTFTAPVTGRYFFNANVTLLQLGAAHTTGLLYFDASNRDSLGTDGNFGAFRDAANTASFSVSCFLDMDAADTCFVVLQVTGGTKTVDVQATNTRFAGYLVC